MRLPALVSALGIAQIISWGTLFYAIGVLGPPMQEALGVNELFVYGAFTGGLLVSGALSPLAGRLIDRRGGGYVLSWGTVLSIAAMLLLASAPNATVMVIGWLVAGAAMAACLYDPAFATLAQHAGAHYRRSVTALTLFGGFASTVFWPLSHVLLEAFGWRLAFAAFAAIHLLVCLPIHLLLPRGGEHARKSAAEEVSPGFADPRLPWLTTSIALSTFVFTVVAVHIVTMLRTAGLTAGEAVTISMLVGPMQVAGRVVEMGFSHRVRAVTVGLATFGLMLLALACLMLVDGFGIAAFVFVTAYGFGNGVFTITRGTAPVELFGPRGIGALLGHLARAALFARAVAPAAFTGLLIAGLTQNAALGCLIALGVAAMATYVVAIRK